MNHGLGVCCDNQDIAMKFGILGLVAFLGLASAVSVPTPLDAWLGTSDGDVICTKPGISCSSDCSYVQLCVLNGDDSYDGYNVESCDSGSTSCDERTHTCTSDASSCPGAVENFTCNTLGMFPDPYNCSVFHICTEKGVADNPQVCPSPYAFNALNGACDTRICLSQPVPKCSKLGQTGPVGATQPSTTCVSLGHLEAFTPSYIAVPMDVTRGRDMFQPLIIHRNYSSP